MIFAYVRWKKMRWNIIRHRRMFEYCAGIFGVCFTYFLYLFTYNSYFCLAKISCYNICRIKKARKPLKNVLAEQTEPNALMNVNVEPRNGKKNIERNNNQGISEDYVS